MLKNFLESLKRSMEYHILIADEFKEEMSEIYECLLSIVFAVEFCRAIFLDICCFIIYNCKKIEYITIKR